MEQLREAYTHELEAVINYLTNSVVLEGILSEEVSNELLQDAQTDEIQHAVRLGNRIAILGGRPPYATEMNFERTSLEPPEDRTDYLKVVKGVIEAEKEAVQLYRKIAKLAAENEDFVTENLVVEILGEEEEHLHEFEGYLEEAEKRRGLRSD